jgi:hypothetical protein
MGRLWIGVATRVSDLKIVSKAAKLRKPLATVEKFVIQCDLARIEMR